VLGGEGAGGFKEGVTGTNIFFFGGGGGRVGSLVLKATRKKCH
jgi:hypothetical protein